MRLLLDEHYSPQIARQLRERSHDIVAVAERPDLVGLADSELLERMASEGRVMLSENAVDFVVLAEQAALAGQEHAGILLTRLGACLGARTRLGCSCALSTRSSRSTRPRTPVRTRCAG